MRPKQRISPAHLNHPSPLLPHPSPLLPHPSPLLPHPSPVLAHSTPVTLFLHQASPVHDLCPSCSFCLEYSCPGNAQATSTPPSGHGSNNTFSVTHSLQHFFKVKPFPTLVNLIYPDLFFSLHRSPSNILYFSIYLFILCFLLLDYQLHEGIFICLVYCCVSRAEKTV